MSTMGKLASIFFYLGCYIISAYFMSRSKIIEKRKIDINFIIAVLVPVLLAANRYNVGSDYIPYLVMYKTFCRSSFTSWLTKEFSLDGTPFGIWFLARVAFQFRSYKMFFGLLATVIYVPAALMIKKHFPKDLSFLGTFLYLAGEFTSGLNISKQIAALAFLIWGIQYVQDRKFWKFMLVIFLAWCFHPTALIAVPIYFLWKQEDTTFSFKRIFFILGGIVFINYIPQLLTAIGGRFETYSIYTDEISNKSFYVNLIWVAFFLLMRKKYTEANWQNDLYITMVIIGLILNVSGFSSPFVKRIAMYYTFPQGFLIFQIPYLFDEREKPLFRFIVFAYIIAIFVANYYFFEFSGIIPYKTYGGA